MASKQEKAFRKLRREFGRIPNRELAERIYLGKIGLFDSRHATFDWRTNLESFGLNVKPVIDTGDLPIVNELYSSDSDISLDFSLTENKYGSVTVQFQNEYSIVTQAYELNTENYEIQALEEELNHKIINQGFHWDLNWIIVTQIYTCSSYTLLINSARDSKITINTGVPIAMTSFNIADPHLNLGIKSYRNMAYNCIGNKNVVPFFVMHQLKKVAGSNRYQLKRFGRI